MACINAATASPGRTLTPTRPDVRLPAHVASVFAIGSGTTLLRLQHASLPSTGRRLQHPSLRSAPARGTGRVMPRKRQVRRVKLKTTCADGSEVWWSRFSTGATPTIFVIVLLSKTLSGHSRRVQSVPSMLWARCVNFGRELSLDHS